jgi:hypothetical protein
MQFKKDSKVSFLYLFLLLLHLRLDFSTEMFRLYRADVYNTRMCLKRKDKQQFIPGLLIFIIMLERRHCKRIIELYSVL